MWETRNRACGSFNQCVTVLLSVSCLAWILQISFRLTSPWADSEWRWWRYLFWYIKQVSFVNASILYRLANCPLPGNRGPYGTKYFWVAVCHGLAAGNICKGKRNVQLGVLTADAGSILSSAHQIDRLHGRKTACCWCSKSGTQTNSGRMSETIYGSTICKIHLHKGLCFASFHQQLA
ncbi:hypothetical protein RRG08_023208 [Elysia crispata]|uniref:Uncharacterized protein n=1 Tax=Elysia crispata TaxID=231223 RepID=A0AAE1DL22_9GAST|nr:hypothetical protein RRG08_023208 [Elysia crispata]